ncbi:hypothetical protein OCA41_14640 [Bacillus cereus]|nr:hypothetical protein [Bacillus cereus]
MSFISDTQKKLKEAARRAEEEVKRAKEEAEKRAREAERIARETEKRAREAERIARETEKRARDEAERIARETEKRARDEAERIARETEKRARDEVERISKEAEQRAREEAERISKEAEQAAENFKKQTETAAKEQIKNAVESLAPEVANMTAEAQKFAKQIQDLQQELMDLANIEAVKRKLLDEAEELSEEYLNTKLKPLAEQLQLAAISDIKLNLINNTEIKMDLYIYFLLLDDKDKDPIQNALGTLTTHLEQSITKLEAPDVQAQFVLNKGNIESIIKEKIESEKDQLIKAFLTQFFSDYIAVFDIIMKYLK